MFKPTFTFLFITYVSIFLLISYVSHTYCNNKLQGPIGSLYRAGPKPYFTRLFNPETYDQAVLKYMAQDGCDRKEAQGNMVSGYVFMDVTLYLN